MLSSVASNFVLRMTWERSIPYLDGYDVEFQLKQLLCALTYNFSECLTLGSWQLPTRSDASQRVISYVR